MSTLEKLKLTDLSLSYGTDVIFDHFNLSVAPGEFVAIVGPSGSGKSTLLKLLAGTLQADSGQLLVDGHLKTDQQSHFGYMPQEDLLLEWESVIDNICLYPRLHQLPIDPLNLSEQIHAFGLAGTEDKYPRELSGGMRQRVALLRTLMTGREVLLLDEPFGALDVVTKSRLQDWLFQLKKELKQTILFVTHDIDEAIYLGDRVLVLGERPAQIKTSFTFENQLKSRDWLLDQGILRKKIYHELKESDHA